MIMSIIEQWTFEQVLGTFPELLHDMPNKHEVA